MNMPRNVQLMNLNVAFIFFSNDELVSFMLQSYKEVGKKTNNLWLFAYLFVFLHLEWESRG